MNALTFEETNLLCIYNPGTRQGAIEALTEMRGELSPDEFAGRDRAAGPDRQYPHQAARHDRRRVRRAGAVPGF